MMEAKAMTNVNELWPSDSVHKIAVRKRNFRTVSHIMGFHKSTLVARGVIRN